MDEKRFVKILWIAKASLLAVLLGVGLRVVTNRWQLGAVLDPTTASGDPRPTEQQTASPEIHSPSDYTAIVQRDLFTGTENAGHSRVTSNSPDSMASAEDLGLRLVGTIAGPTTSRAIIQNTTNNATASYKIGDPIASATVEAIQRDLVILRYNGQALVLRRRAGTASGSKSNPGKDGPQNAKATEATLVVNPQTARPSSRAGYVTDIFRQATIEPYVKNDQVEGLRITGLEEIPMAALLGLKNGDIVQRVNGQQLTSKQKAFQVLMKARTQSRVNLQLLRDGQSKDLSFDL